MANTGQGGSDNMALLWQLEQPGRRGRRPSLTLADIVAAAVEIADANGLGDVSMARVAKRLGFSTMALYRHVPNKGELLDLMFDAGVGPPPASILAASGWRARIQEYRRAFSQIFQRRPWLLDIPITAPPTSPNNIRWLETALMALEETGLDARDRVEVFLLITSYLLGNVRLEVEMTRAAAASRSSENPTQDPVSYGAMLTELMPPGMFPAVEAAIAAGAFDDDDNDEVERGLDHILDGIEVLMRRRGIEGG